MATQQPRVRSNEDIRIDAGPSEEDMFKALRFGPSIGEVWFVSVDGLRFVTNITGLERGAGAIRGGHSWLVKGFALEPKTETISNRKWRPIIGSYYASTRIGIIQFVD